MTDEIISDSKSTSTEPERQESLVGQSASVPVKPAEEQRIDSRSVRSEKISDEPAPSTPDENQSPTGESHRRVSDVSSGPQGLCA